jgi:hypothetical protein
MGPTHLGAARWTGLRYVGSALLFLAVFIFGTVLVFRFRKRIVSRLTAWQEKMKMPVVLEKPDPQGTESADKQENHENE